MASQGVWVGITIGVFFAGLGIGYAVFTSPINPNTMTPQMFNQMMSNPQMMNSMIQNQQFMQTMLNDPQHMRAMMQNPLFAQQTLEHMKQNHEFTQDMMAGITSDSDLRLQMLGHMSENQEAMQQMMQMTQGNITGKSMGPGMMMNP